MVETVVAMAVLMIGLLAVTSSLWRGQVLVDSNRSQRLAQNEVRAMAEEMQAFSQATLVAGGDWSQAIADAFAAGGSVGNTFAVPGLSAPEGEASVGTITIIADESLTDQGLGFELGMPRDLDGDGLMDNTDVRGSAALLPVLITLRWQRRSGVRQFVHGFYLLGL